ncbi:hypothetical protein C8Q78DRAFT_963217 [Trametes maxima]|nr:hypothetical protein C8Q78DRAFT_963217 [Trametes maxima]
MAFLTTQPCIYYSQGRCAKGDQCRFFHSRPRGDRPPGLGLCKFFAQGRCAKGGACPFPHITNAKIPTKMPSLLPSYTSTAQPIKPAALFVPCKFFRQNRCTKGANCPFPHPAATPVKTPLVSSTPTSPILIPEAPESISTEEQVPVELTTSRTKLGCRVTYGPGAAVQAIDTAFESPRVILHNLPPSIAHSALIALAESFGALKNVILNPTHDHQSRPSASIEYLTPSIASQAAKDIIHDPLLRGASARLDLRAAESGTAMLRSTKAKLSWFSPSLTAWAHYSALSKAKDEAVRLNGMSFNGCKVRASFQVPTWNQKTSFSVELKGLPLDAKVEHLKRFCHASSVTTGRPSFSVDASVKELRTLLEGQGPLESFEFVKSDTPTPKSINLSKLVAFVQFADADNAARAVTKPHATPQRFLRGSQIFLELIHSVKYTLQQAQFRALRGDIDALRDSLETCKLRYYDHDALGQPTEKVYVRAYGPDAQAVGRLKKELESMLRGDVVRGDDRQVLWHDHFGKPSGKAFLEALAERTQTYIRCDDRTRTVHLFGHVSGRLAARAQILQKAEELNAVAHIIELDETTFRRMLHGSFQGIQTAFLGKVFFDVVQRRLVIEGDQDDVRAIRAAVQQQSVSEPTRASTDDTPCPVCFCDVSDPLALPCGHTYCRECLRHFLGSLAHSTGGAGPVQAVCLAEIAKFNDPPTPCGSSIPLEVIRVLLSPGEEERILEATFLSFIHSRPQQFKYCPTADCQIVYRAGKEDTQLRCPSCLARICAFCHVEAHEGLSCAGYKDQASGGEDSFRRWREENGVKACPGCGTGLEKSGGCNHMQCRQCGAHMCWVCLQVFTETDSGEGVYSHMRRVHGGIGI